MTEPTKPTAFTIVDNRRSSFDDEVSAKEPTPAAPPAPAPAKPVVTDKEVLAAERFHAVPPANKKAALADLYRFGVPQWSFVNLKPNSVLLRPLRKPVMSTGGLYTTNEDETTATMGTAAMAYVVLGVADLHEEPGERFMPVQPGSVVLVRSAMLEPLDVTLSILSLHIRYVLAEIGVEGFHTSEEVEKMMAEFDAATTSTSST